MKVLCLLQRFPMITKATVTQHSNATIITAREKMAIPPTVAPVKLTLDAKVKI